MKRRTYDEIWEAIKKALLLPKWAKAIVRRSMMRPGGGVGQDFVYQYRLPPGGRPGDALTKLPEPPDTQPDDFLARHSVGWRGPSTPRFKGTDTSWSYAGGGPPCSVRHYSAQYLRDTDLLSGVDNQGKFGFSYDLWMSDATGSGDGTVNSWWVRRAHNPEDFNYYANTNEPLDVEGQFKLATWGVNGPLTSMDPIPLHGSKARLSFSGYYRLVAYITRAEHPYRFVFQHSGVQYPRPAIDSPWGVTVYIPMGTFTGRFISGWIPQTFYSVSGSASTGYSYTYRAATLDKPIYGTLPGTAGAQGYRQGESEGDKVVSVEHSASPNRAVGTPEQLANGWGPLCIPFIEVEQKTLYNPQGHWEVQDEDTPGEWRTTEIDRRVAAGEWPYPTSWPY